MELNQKQLNEGLKFIVGTWQIDYLVNMWSDNLDHVPASQFKNNDGKDLSQISWEFFEDHTMKMRNGATGDEETGTWKQESESKFRYDTKWFGLIDNETVLNNIQQLEKDVEGGLVFSMFFVIRLKKTAEGECHIVEEPKEPDIGDIVPSEEDLKKKDIVGRWGVYKAMASVGEDFGMFTLADVKADIEKAEKEEEERQKKEAAEGKKPKEKKEGDDDDEEEDEGEIARRRIEGKKEGLTAFNAIVEFTDDHKVKMLMPIPPEVPKEEIEKAVASGEVQIVDGLIQDGDPKEWKFVKGDYYYNTGEHREIFGEVVSPWDKITPDSEGHIDFKMFILEKKK